MFDGGEQFHQFIASSRTSLPIPTLPFPLHGNPSFSAAFDSYAPPLHHQPTTTKNLTLIDPKHVPKYPLISTNLALESDRSTDPWSNDELLALLKVRSSMEIWFPDFTWEHVSRKLGELGFKRCGEQCKEKFEEESRHFNNSVNHNKNYRILSELDEFYHAHDEQEQEQEQDQEQVVQMKKVEDAAAEGEEGAAKKATKSSSSKKRKRRDKFEMFKGFCEAVMNKMMAKQEELHQKLIHDIVKRDEEKIAREEAWKNQEMDRVKTEIETRSKEQKCAAERQATIIEFLKQFTCDQDQLLKNKIDHLVKVNNNTTTTTPNSNSNSNSSASFCEIPQTDRDVEHQNPTPSFPSQNSPNPSSPSSILAAKDSISKPSDHDITPPPPPPPAYEKGGGDVGKRWPRDEVLALIKLRCKMSNNNGCDGQEISKEGSNAKGPLWERISQGMMEMGYKRNAKRCKEKWENINKYFRKTKDSSKKRSVNSRTCPYFHQLSCLYSDGTIVAPNQMPENH